MHLLITLHTAEVVQPRQQSHDHVCIHQSFHTTVCLHDGLVQPALHFQEHLDCHGVSMQEVTHELQQELQVSGWRAQAESRVVDRVPELPQAMLLHGGGQQEVDYATSTR